MMQRQGIEMKAGGGIHALGDQPGRRDPSRGLQMGQGLHTPVPPAAAAATAQHHRGPPGLQSGAGADRRRQGRGLGRVRKAHGPAGRPGLLQQGGPVLRFTAFGQEQRRRFAHATASHTTAGSCANSGPTGVQPGARPGAAGVGPAACNAAR